MNKEIFAGKWDELKGHLKKQWGKLTDNDLAVIRGNHEEIFGRLKQHYGFSKEQIQKSLKEFKTKYHCDPTDRKH